MNWSHVFGPIAATYGVGMSVSPLLQIVQMLRTRSSRDVSLPYWSVLMGGFILWTLYGVSAHNAVVWVPNAVACVTGALTLFVTRMLRNETEQQFLSNPALVAQIEDSRAHPERLQPRPQRPDWLEKRLADQDPT